VSPENLPDLFQPKADRVAVLVQPLCRRNLVPPFFVQDSQQLSLVPAQLLPRVGKSDLGIDVVLK